MLATCNFFVCNLFSTFKITTRPKSRKQPKASNCSSTHSENPVPDDVLGNGCHT